METRKKRTKVVVSILALGGLLIFSLFAVAGDLEPSAPPGPTMKTLNEVEPKVPIHASDLPLTISEPNSYYLVEDVNFTDTSNHAITIECNDVTIDLMGFSLIGPASGTGCGIYMNGCSNVEICNGTVRDFGLHGIYGYNANNSKKHRVVGLRAMSNGGGGILLMGFGHVVKDCTATKNSKEAMIFYGGISVGKGSTVTGNTAYDNQDYGIGIGYGCTALGNTASYNQNNGIDAGRGCTITNNTVYNNHGNGIFTRDGSTVTGNTAYNNDDSGIYAYNEGTLVSANTVLENNQSDSTGCAGIRVECNCMVKSNMLCGNKKYNIYMYSSGNAVEENLVNGSENGIYFNGSLNFYANNRASGNATDYANTTGNTNGGGNVSL